MGQERRAFFLLNSRNSNKSSEDIRPPYAIYILWPSLLSSPALHLQKEFISPLFSLSFQNLFGIQAALENIFLDWKATSHNICSPACCFLVSVESLVFPWLFSRISNRVTTYHELNGPQAPWLEVFVFAFLTSGRFTSEDVFAVCIFGNNCVALLFCTFIPCDFIHF